MQKTTREIDTLQILTHFSDEYDRTADNSIRGFDRNPDLTLTLENYYADFAEEMQEIGYDNYTDYELYHPLPKANDKTMNIEFADLNAQLAAEYIRDILKKTKTLNTTINR